MTIAMSILIFGITICPICGKPIFEEEPYYLFPAFVINILDPLYYFNDNAFHEKCLSENPLSQVAKSFSISCIERNKPANRICLIRGNLITDFRDHVSLGLFSTNKSNELYPFNYSHIDKRNIPDWKGKVLFRQKLENLASGFSWKEIDDKLYLRSLITLFV